MTEFTANTVLWSLDEYMKVRKDEMPIYYKKENQMSNRVNRKSAHLQSYKDAEADLSQDEDENENENDDGDFNFLTVQRGIDVDDATHTANMNQLNFEKNDFDQLMYNESLETNNVNSSAQQCAPLSRTPPRPSVKSRLGVRPTESGGNRGKRTRQKAIQKRGKAYANNINSRNNSMVNFNQNRVSVNFHRGLEAYKQFRERNASFGQRQNVLNIPNNHVHIENMGPNGPSFNESSNTDNFNLNSSCMMRSNHMNTSDSNSYGRMLSNNQGPVNLNNYGGLFPNNQGTVNTNSFGGRFPNNQGPVNSNSRAGLFPNNQGSVNSNSSGGLFPNNEVSVNSNNQVPVNSNNQVPVNSNSYGGLLSNHPGPVNSNSYGVLLSNNQVPVNSNNQVPVNSNSYGGFPNNQGPVNSNGYGGLLSNYPGPVNSNSNGGLLSNYPGPVNSNSNGGLLSNTTRRDIIANNWNSSMEMNLNNRITPNNFSVVNRQEPSVDGDLGSLLSVAPTRPKSGMFVGEALGMSLSDCKTADVQKIAQNVLFLLATAENDSQSKTNYGVHNKNTSQQRHS